MSALRGNANFQRLFWATGVSNLGDGISAMAVPWLAALITRDPFLVAFVSFGQRVPWLLFALPAGVITDRVDRRRLILRADILRTGLTALVLALVLALPEAPAEPAVWIGGLAALSFLLGSAEVFRDNAAQTILPAIVPAGALETANGRMWGVEHITSLIGPPLAGAMIALWLPLPFLVDAASFGLAALLVSMIGLPARPAPPRRKLLVEMQEGWVWMKAHPVILQLALMLGGLNFATMMVMAILVLYAQDVLGLGALGHGILLACGAAGGVTAGLVGPWIVARLGGQRVLYGALCCMAIALALYTVTGAPWVAGFAEAVLIFGGVMWNIVTVSYRQRHIPDALLGRVNSIYRFFGWGSLSIAALTGGALASALAPLGRDMALRLPFALACVIVIALLGYAFARLRLR
ncbi:MFS transporter [Roseobacteraceae bacterium S113]